MVASPRPDAQPELRLIECSALNEAAVATKVNSGRESMRFILRSVPQMLVMAAVVTTALWVPVGAVLAFFGFALFGVSLRAFVTFGGFLAPFPGLLAWWAVLFLPALVYAACAMPWSHGYQDDE